MQASHPAYTIAEPTTTRRSCDPTLMFEATSTRLLKRTLLGLLLLAALVVVASSALHPGRAARLERLGASSARLGTLMRETERTNEVLTSELKSLERGAAGWQSLARKEYGMLLKGEVVFRFPPADAPEPPALPLLPGIAERVETPSE